MQMYMEDGLPGRLIAIHYRPVALVRQSFGSRNVTSGRIQAADDSVIVVAYVIDCGNMFSRNNQHMRRRFRVDVAKCDSSVRFKDDIGRNITGQNPAEQAIVAVLGHTGRYSTTRRP